MQQHLTLVVYLVVELLLSETGLLHVCVEDSQLFSQEIIQEPSTRCSINVRSMFDQCSRQEIGSVSKIKERIKCARAPDCVAADSLMSGLEGIKFLVVRVERSRLQRRQERGDDRPPRGTYRGTHRPAASLTGGLTAEAASLTGGLTAEAAAGTTSCPSGSPPHGPRRGRRTAPAGRGSHLRRPGKHNRDPTVHERRRGHLVAMDKAATQQR